MPTNLAAKASPGTTKATSKTAPTRDLRCPALVLRRTNYGEADRILNLITPSGLVALIARGVRKEKSKLAGGIELFCLSEITYHQKKDGSLGILTSAKMQKFYRNILADFNKMSFASEVLKKVSRIAEQVDGGEFYQLTQSVLEALDAGFPMELIETYFYLNFTALKGEAINFSRDTNGAKLTPNQTYLWDSTEQAFSPAPQGNYGAHDIKYLRLMLSSSLLLCSRVQYPPQRLAGLLYIARSLGQF